jgi:hypothetical protein
VGFAGAGGNTADAPFQWKLAVDPALFAGTRYETSASGDVRTPTGVEWKVEAQSVSFSPMGNRVNLKTASSSGAPVNLAVLDEKGNYLMVQDHGGTMNLDTTPENPFVDEYCIPFMGGEGSKKLTLVPYYYPEPDERDEAPEEAPDEPAALLPLTAPLPARVELADGVAIIIDAMHFDVAGGSVAWRLASLTDGLFDFKLCDADGRALDLGRYAEGHYDYATGAKIEFWIWMSQFRDGAMRPIDEPRLRRGHAWRF